jgi:hypothetical protein
MILGRVLKFSFLAFLIAIGSFAIAIKIGIYKPCVIYVQPQTDEVKHISNLVKSFQKKYNRLPDTKSLSDLKILGLDSKIVEKITILDASHFTVYSNDGRGFDGQSASYDSNLDTITCSSF